MLKSRKALINSSSRRRPGSSTSHCMDPGLRRDDARRFNQGFPGKIGGLLLAGCILLLMAGTKPGLASGTDPYPAFVATYDANANGIGIGTVQVSLTHEGNNEYLYRQESVSTGIAALFGNNDSTQESRWRYRNRHIQVLDYRSRQRGGDDDNNEHLVFDWKTRRVKNTGAGQPWEITLPDNAVDRLVMQLAMLFDLRDGKTELSYQVPRNGRIKTYTFALVGEETLELASGRYRTLKLVRTNDDKDKSWVWSAPDLDYFPIRFLKHKKSGLKVELVLRKLEFLPGSHSQGIEPATAEQQ